MGVRSVIHGVQSKCYAMLQQMYSLEDYIKSETLVIITT